jgi:hypothetical protein
MEHKQMKFQKIIMIVALVLASTMFMFALGFATNLYSLAYHADSTSSMLYIEGAELYVNIQPFNKQLFRDSAIQMILCILMFLVLTHRRRLYYLSNYITTAAFCAYAVYFGATLTVNALYIKQLYRALDFEKMKEITDMLSLRFVNSTFMMDAGVMLSVLLIITSIGLIANLIWKSINMKKEKKIMGGAKA